MKQSTAKALIIATAKAHGVMTAKGQFDSLYADFKKGQQMANALAARGKNQDRPSVDIWNGSEIYAIGEYARGLLVQIQNLQGDKWDLDPLVRRMTDIANRSSRLVQRLRKGGRADGFAYEIGELGKWFKQAMSVLSLARSNALSRKI